VAVGRIASALACVLALAAGGTALAHPSDSALDPDHDGFVTPNDNCPDTPNQFQTDTDNDGAGDACDDDDDGDHVDDARDNCRLATNPAQTDTDLDDDGDECDADDDGDNVVDSRDNCPLAPNESQADSDRDGKGDACDPAPAPASGSAPATPGGGALARVSVGRRQSLVQLVDGGLAVAVRCSAACGIASQLTLGRGDARRLGFGRRRTVAQATWTLGGAARTFVFLEPSYTAGVKLRRAHGVSALVTTTITDGTGARRRIASRVRFR
jgi:hypothetical protein